MRLDPTFAVASARRGGAGPPGGGGLGWIAFGAVVPSASPRSTVPSSAAEKIFFSAATIRDTAAFWGSCSAGRLILGQDCTTPSSRAAIRVPPPTNATPPALV